MLKEQIRLGFTLLFLTLCGQVTISASNWAPSDCFTKTEGRVILDRARPLSMQMNRANVIYEVRDDFDLAGSTIRLPDGCIIEFNGGKFYNGLVVGEKMPTKETYRPEDFGAGQSDDTYAIQSCLNICRNVALDGSYQVSSHFDKKDNVILSVPSETSISLKGVLNLSPVDSPRYSILSVKNSTNISITGGGKIIGDKETTNVTKGEHGMGISITGESRGITIEGLDISNCFGDAIYIGVEMRDRTCLEPSYITVNDCALHHCRRQGISIVIGHHITIDNCDIHDIQGTAPGAAIDIEPQYKGYKVHDLHIGNSSFNNCVLALSCGGADKASYNITVFNCTSDSGPIVWRLGDNTIFDNCTFKSPLYVDNIKIVYSFVASLYYKGDNKTFDDTPNIIAKNSKFQVVGCVQPTGYIRMEKCTIDYPSDKKELNGSPLKGGYLELIDCSCTGLGTNYRFAPDIKYLKATNCFFQYNKAVCVQGDVLDLNRCVIKGENVEEDNTLVYARKGGSRMKRCEVTYLNDKSSKPVWVIRAGEEGGLNVERTTVLSKNPKVIKTRNVNQKSIRFLSERD